MERAERIAHSRAVKLHIFMPSNRRVWTVVGRMHEYWVHPPGFCTCKDYYFRARALAAEGREDGMIQCYHLRAVKMAESSYTVDEVHFHDDEYHGFIRAVIDMIYRDATEQSRID